MKKIIWFIILFVSFISNGYAVGLGHSFLAANGIMERVTPGSSFQWNKDHSYFAKAYGEETECITVKVVLSDGLSFDANENVSTKDLGEVCNSDFENDEDIKYFDIDDIYVKEDAAPGLEKISIYVDGVLEEEPYYIIVYTEGGSENIEASITADKSTVYAGDEVNYTFTITNSGDYFSDYFCLPGYYCLGSKTILYLSELFNLEEIVIISSYLETVGDYGDFNLNPGETYTVSIKGTVSEEAVAGDLITTSFAYDEDTTSTHTILVIEDTINETTTVDNNTSISSEATTDDPNDIENPQTGIHIYYIFIPLILVTVLVMKKQKRKIFKI